MFAGHQPDILVFNVPNASERQGEKRCMNCRETPTGELVLLLALCTPSHTAENVVDFPKNNEDPK
jgi:hypothetical protein